MENLQNMFVDSNEKQIATLGGSYLKNFLTTGSLDKGFCAVSDKRVYFRGKCYYKSGNSYKNSKEERTVDLSDITGTGFVITRHWLLRIISFVLIIPTVALFFFLYGTASESIMFITIWACLLIGTIACGVLYFVLKLRLFEISYAGGKIAFKASNYSEEEMQTFQKQLRMAKDNYNPSVSTSVNTASSSMADELKKYKDLLDAGAISQEEYDSVKSKLLS